MEMSTSIDDHDKEYKSESKYQDSKEGNSSSVGTRAFTSNRIESSISASMNPELVERLGSESISTVAAFLENILYNCAPSYEVYHGEYSSDNALEAKIMVIARLVVRNHLSSVSLIYRGENLSHHLNTLLDSMRYEDSARTFGAEAA